MPEESDFCIFELPPSLCSSSLLSKSDSYLSLAPPLSLEEVAFMPEESDFCFFQLPPSLCSSSLLSKSESFLFSSTPTLSLEEVAFMPEESEKILSYS